MFRRKCEDEIVQKKHVQIPYARGSLGEPLIYLSGYDPTRTVAFCEADPDGDLWLAQARDRVAQSIAIQRSLPQDPRVDPSALVDNELAEWWSP